MEYLNELNTGVAFLTETWLSDTIDLKDDIRDLELGTGYSMLCKNRPVNARGYSTGGLAIVYKKSQIEFTELNLPGYDYEVLFAVGKMPLFSRKFVAISVYMPPSMPAAGAASCMTYLVDAILELKTRYRDPFICIAGDFNSHNIQSYLDDYPDLSLVQTGADKRKWLPGLDLY